MSIECPNHKTVSDKLSSCSVLTELGIPYIVSPNRSGSPCIKCIKEWETPPTIDSLTQVMKSVVKANGRIELPTIKERAISFGKALKEWVFDGFANMPEAGYQKRVNCCKENRCGMFDGKNCLACGCKIEDSELIKGKARYPLQTCPADLPEWKDNPGVEYLNQPNPGQCGSCGKR